MSEALSWAIIDDSGERLDRHIARHLNRPRNQVSHWITEDRVRVNGRPAKASTILHPGDAVSCSPPEDRADPGLDPEAGNLVILHEDPDLVIVDKPAGTAVHPGAGRTSGTLVHYLLDRFPDIGRVGGSQRPGIVHRLDLDTTGALIVARSEPAFLRLSSAFAERRIGKTYVAIVYGTPRENPGRIDLPIGRHRHQRKQMQVRHDGRPALTHYRTLESTMGVSRLEIDLETGRTHQIRIHLKAIGHPLVGDPTYGEARWRNLPVAIKRPLREFARPALHAWRLAFDHPMTGERIAIEAPVPADLQRLWREVAGREWDPAC